MKQCGPNFMVSIEGLSQTWSLSSTHYTNILNVCMITYSPVLTITLKWNIHLLSMLRWNHSEIFHTIFIFLSIFVGRIMYSTEKWATFLWLSHIHQYIPCHISETVPVEGCTTEFHPKNDHIKHFIPGWLDTSLPSSQISIFKSAHTITHTHWWLLFTHPFKGEV